MKQLTSAEIAELMRMVVIGYGCASLLLHIGEINEADFVKRFKQCSDYWDENVAQFEYPLVNRIQDELQAKEKQHTK